MYAIRSYYAYPDNSSGVMSFFPRSTVTLRFFSLGPTMKVTIAAMPTMMRYKTIFTVSRMPKRVWRRSPGDSYNFV